MSLIELLDQVSNEQVNRLDQRREDEMGELKGKKRGEYLDRGMHWEDGKG
uniref:Uncharacterized protein n=1 Tax=Nelumbo nucifera TaxID=4432 RepID=A0A822YJ61_NELNU|nr:TPA_asm: hypothetical protein HUJ06_011471 [Nelumbo nucifera]